MQQCARSISLCPVIPWRATGRTVAELGGALAGRNAWSGVIDRLSAFVADEDVPVRWPR